MPPWPSVRASTRIHAYLMHSCSVAHAACRDRTALFAKPIRLPLLLSASCTLLDLPPGLSQRSPDLNPTDRRAFSPPLPPPLPPLPLGRARRCASSLQSRPLPRAGTAPRNHLPRRRRARGQRSTSPTCSPQSTRSTPSVRPTQGSSEP
jgi:hypothetical protein